MSSLRRPDAYTRRYRRSLRRSEDSRLSRPAFPASPDCSRSPKPTLRNRRMMAKLAAFADVSLSPIHRFVPVRKFPFLNSCAPPKTPEKRPCAPEDGIRKMASLTARNRLFHDIVPDFRDRPAMENRVRFSYASFQLMMPSISESITPSSNCKVLSAWLGSGIAVCAATGPASVWE